MQIQQVLPDAHKKQVEQYKNNAYVLYDHPAVYAVARTWFSANATTGVATRQ